MDKQTAIDLLDNLLGMVEDNHDSDYDTAIKMGIDALKTQDMSGNMSGTHNSLDCISRQAAIESADKIISRDDSGNNDVVKAMTAWKEFIKELPSVQPDDAALHESCTDCPLYDHDRHNCPRFNKVIPTAIRDAQTGEVARDIATIIENEKDMRVILKNAQLQRWIPVTEWLPENDFTDVLICIHDVRHGCEDDYYIAQAHTVRGHWKPTLDINMDDLDVVAWMPLPECYKGEQE